MVGMEEMRNAYTYVARRLGEGSLKSWLNCSYSCERPVYHPLLMQSILFMKNF
jgi:hypothetical protein